jgi:transposase/phage terminase Nu1 subunit (DNA packaging protein)
MLLAGEGGWRCMAGSLSIDLRRRVVEAIAGGSSCRAAAQRFGVSVSSAIRWRAQERREGDVTPKRQCGDRHSQGIEAHAELILTAVAAKSDMTLAELREHLRERGVVVAIGTLWRFFKRRKITRKKPDGADEMVSASVLAGRLALTPTTVSKLGGNGIMIRNQRGAYALWPSIRSYVEHLRKASTGRESPTAVARSALLRIQKDRAQLSLDKESGRLMDIHEVNAYVLKILSDARQRALMLPTIITQRASLSREQSAVAEDEVRRYLTDLAEAEEGPPTEQEVAACMAIRQRNGWVRKEWR